MMHNKGRTIRPTTMSGFKLSEGVRVGQSTLFHGHIESDCKIPVAYHAHSEGDEGLKRWHDLGLELSHPNILRVIGRTGCDEEGLEILVTEYVDRSLQSWVEENPLLLPASPLYPSSLQPCFRNFLRDMLKGMIFLRFTINRAHGEIFEANVFVKDDSAKLTNVMDHEMLHQMVPGNPFEADIEKFVQMVGRFFKKQQIPLELHQFCISLKAYKISDRYFSNSIYHPVLLGATDRLNYRHKAFSLIADNGHSQQMDALLIAGFNGKRRPYSWKINVTRPEFKSILNYRFSRFGDTPMEFLRFTRNCTQHIRENGHNLTDEEVDNYLNSILPGFMVELHDCLHMIKLLVVP